MYPLGYQRNEKARMQLSNERSKFEVEILGYEFPNSKDKDDASWLLSG